MILSIGCSFNNDIDGVLYEDINDMFDQEVDEVISIEFEEIYRSKYDSDSVLENRKLQEDVSFLFVEDVYYQKVLDELEEEGGFSYPEDFDFENFHLLVAYGREIVELDCASSKYIRHQYAPYFYMLSITFGEEYYGSTVFLYKTKKVSNMYFVRTIYEIRTYVMNGTEKEQVYVGYINRPKRFGPDGVG